ncbi:MAG: PBP1A family penicillin-binding protein [Candidatus Moranbacteria bacterium]|nr:PBP1A family penicillin-binding protein [Candidatus Moranbacteria bacterium]
MELFKKKLKPLVGTIIKESVLVTLNVFLMLGAIASGVFLYAYVKAPIAATLTKRDSPQTTLIYDRTGQHVLYEIHGEENRIILSHDEIPDSIRIATIATEDDSFYSHFGIDFLAILRALKNNVQKNSMEQGASTITQQLARNAFLTREKTIRRKIAELIIAIKIERKYSKDQILDMYLNEIPYGSNAYGIESAAKTFFGKNAKDLTLDEAALLSAIPKATSYYSPYGNHLDELLLRQQKTLDRIGKLQLADPATVAQAKREPVARKIIPFSDTIDAPHFVFYVREELEKRFEPETIEEGGLRIYTTLDYEKQKSAERIIAESDANLKKYGASNAALVSLDPKNGQILAMVGSRDYFDDSIDGQVNVAIRPRQPGSSFKPFAYAAAFEKGFQPETKILDTRTDFGADGSGKHYVPRNYDGKFHGVVTMRQALAMSLNVPAVKTLSLAGVQATIDLAHRLGITTLNDTGRYGLSLVLGGGEVKLLDETAGYAVFANDGKKNTPASILKITDSRGKIIHTAAVENTPVLDPQIARKIDSILSDNAARVPIFGPNNKLHIPGKVVAAKTGTTSEFKDAWTVGYTPHLVTGVWVGNNDSRPMRAGADGSYVAAPIWNRFMSQALEHYPVEPFLAYEKTEDKNKLADDIVEKITYFKKASGKKISKKKAKKMAADKVEIRIEYVRNATSVK